MLSELLKDNTLNQMSNLVVNQSDCFGKYISSSGKLGEVNSGYWYQQAYERMVIDTNNDFLMPIILAMNKTTISSPTNLHVFAIMFTTTFFDWKTRNLAQAWCPLGYIPTDCNFYLAQQWNDMSTNLKSLRLNMMFDTRLQSFCTAQSHNA